MQRPSGQEGFPIETLKTIEFSRMGLKIQDSREVFQYYLGSLIEMIETIEFNRRGTFS